MVVVLQDQLEKESMMIVTSDEKSAKNLLLSRARKIHPELKIDSRSSLSDILKKIPILSKSELAKHMPEKNLWLESAILFSETSGTTGYPLETPRGCADLSWNVFNQMNAYRKFLRPGYDRVAILHPSILSPFVEASSIALKNLGIGQIRIFPIQRVCEYDRIYDVLSRYKITAIMSTPSLIYKLLYEFSTSKNHVVPKTLGKFLLTGESFSKNNMRNLKRIVGDATMVVPFVYGSSESATLMVGREDGFFDPIIEDFIFELVNFGSNQESRLVVSWLREGLMPILRYDTGDCFELISNSPPVFSFKGRSGFTKDESRFRELIEDVVYSLDIPVFHYECKFSEEDKKLELVIVVDTQKLGFEQEVSMIIERAFPGWVANVKINPDCCEFMAFAALPKTKKFMKTRKIMME